MQPSNHTPQGLPKRNENITTENNPNLGAGCILMRGMRRLSLPKHPSRLEEDTARWDKEQIPRLHACRWAGDRPSSQLCAPAAVAMTHGRACTWHRQNHSVLQARCPWLIVLGGDGVIGCAVLGGSKDRLIFASHSLRGHPAFLAGCPPLISSSTTEHPLRDKWASSLLHTCECGGSHQGKEGRSPYLRSLMESTGKGHAATRGSRYEHPEVLRGRFSADIAKQKRLT